MLRFQLVSAGFPGIEGEVALERFPAFVVVLIQTIRGLQPHLVTAIFREDSNINACRECKWRQERGSEVDNKTRFD